MINKLKQNAVNILGWRTNRKIVVFESDDWGSIRMPSKEVYDEFLKLGYDLSSNPYCKYDTLANSRDLSALFDILTKYRDRKENPPIITFNTVVGNPDFKKIEESGFLNYYYEPFTETLLRYYPNENVFDLWEQGIKEKLIQPQFHGREHVNVPLWLEQLNINNKSLQDAFDYGFWGIPKALYTSANLNIQASYRSNKKEHVREYTKAIKEGLDLFEQIFKFNSKTFIANNYTWPLELNSILYEKGVEGFQCMKFHKIPQNNSTLKLHRIYTGKRNELQQLYTLRNCFFEPSQMPYSFDNVGNCLNQIKYSFLWKKPAIITTHRVNYVGVLDENNREGNLKQLDLLIKNIVSRWPDVEFMSSDQLVTLINKK